MKLLTRYADLEGVAGMGAETKPVTARAATNT
jgi:hypothetical protein